MCRARFELDDIAEAAAVTSQALDQGFDSDVNPDDVETGINSERRSLIHSTRRRTVLTWRMPEWINFSYSTMRQRPNYQKDRRKPIPFDRDNKAAARFSADSTPDVRARGSGRAASEGSPSVQRPLATPIQQRSKPTTGEALPNHPGPVTPHPPPVPWDDQETADLPYDNPYYTRPIDNALWLPRDPVNVLDLDDTVDMRVSITVRVQPGQLGTWLGMVETASPQMIAQNNSSKSNRGELTASLVSLPVSYASLPEVDGTEEIDLPPTIKQRVQANERGIEHTLRTKKSSLSQSSPMRQPDLPTLRLTARRRSSALTLDPHIRSVSGDGLAPPSLRPRSSSAVSNLQLPPLLSRHRTKSAGAHSSNSGLRPDAHAQAEVIAAAETSNVSLAPSRMARNQNLSAHDAILHEVLAEEKQALLDRLQNEQAEATQPTSTRSWLLSWMFRRAE